MGRVWSLYSRAVRHHVSRGGGRGGCGEWAPHTIEHDEEELVGCAAAEEERGGGVDRHGDAQQDVVGKLALRVRE